MMSHLTSLIFWIKANCHWILGQIINYLWLSFERGCDKCAKIYVCCDDCALRHGLFIEIFIHNFSWHCTDSATTLTNTTGFNSSTAAPVLCKLRVWSNDRLLLQFNNWVVLWCKYSGNQGWLEMFNQLYWLLYEWLLKWVQILLLSSTTNFPSHFWVVKEFRSYNTA